MEFLSYLTIGKPAIVRLWKELGFWYWCFDDHHSFHVICQNLGSMIIILRYFSTLLSIKRSTQLKKLMNAYCDRQSVDFKSIAFFFMAGGCVVNRHRKKWASIFVLSFVLQTFSLVWIYLCFNSLPACDGRWWWDRCHAASDWR